VPAGSARRRLAELEASGMTRGQIAQLAGVSAGTISRLAKPATKRISLVTATGVMAVTP
jgi:transcriptional regulator with XRE-family HTH domain